MENKDYYSPAEAAEALGIRYGAVMRLIRSGKLKATKVGWAWIISKSDLENVRASCNISA